MVIAIFKSLEGENLEDYGIRLAQQWRIGQKSLDNGVILLVFLEERRLRLEVGYGLEGSIPDAIAGQIIREVIGPRFRERRYAAGLDAAIDAVYARVESRPVATGARHRHASDTAVWWMGALFVIIAVVLFRELRSPVRRAPRSGWTATRNGWSAPTVIYPWWGSGGGGWSSGGGGGFSGGGGSFGGGGASGEW